MRNMGSLMVEVFLGKKQGEQLEVYENTQRIVNSRFGESRNCEVQLEVWRELKL